jgi:hypothetical protein
MAKLIWASCKQLLGQAVTKAYLQRIFQSLIRSTREVEEGVVAGVGWLITASSLQQK